jgi:hypothetical protein
MGLNKEHIGKEIEVEIGVFTSELANSLQNIRRRGVLLEYDEKTGYCRYSINGIIQPVVHESSIKYIYEN